ncbi:MAG: hypothetical protein WDN46_06665 [Methylocella sp.]
MIAHRSIPQTDLASYLNRKRQDAVDYANEHPERPLSSALRLVASSDEPAKVAAKTSTDPKAAATPEAARESGRKLATRFAAISRPRFSFRGRPASVERPRDPAEFTAARLTLDRDFDDDFDKGNLKIDLDHTRWDKSDD